MPGKIQTHSSHKGTCCFPRKFLSTCRKTREFRIFSFKGSPPNPSKKERTPSPSAQLGLFYLAYYGYAGIKLPYWPLWLATCQGLTGEQIGIVLGVSQVIRTAVGPLIGFLSDVTSAPRALATMLSICSIGVHAIMLWSLSFNSLAVCICLASVLISAILPLGESLAVKTLPDTVYGRVRLWGSVAFLLSNVLGGKAISHLGFPYVMVILLFSCLCICVSSLFLPTRRASEEQISEEKTIRQNSTVQNSPAKIASFFCSSWMLPIFLFSASTIQSAHALYYCFGSFFFKSAGYNENAIGVLWAVGVAAEICIFARKDLMANWSARQFLVVGGIASLVRWTLMATNPPLPLMFLVQALHGLTFGITHLGTIKFLQTAIPLELSATVYGLYSAVSDGIFMAGATFLSGKLYSTYGSMSFFAMGLLGMIGGISATLLRSQTR